MSGPEHYRAAEEFIVQSGADNIHVSTRDSLIAIAQVHATLALVAVQVDTAENLHGKGKAWAEVTR